MPPEHYERKHRDQIDDEEGCREQEVADPLPQVIHQHHCQKEQKREHDNKDPTLQERGVDAVYTDQSA
jgi:hypothetical protein